MYATVDSERAALVGEHATGAAEGAMPAFWVTAMRRHPFLTEIITDKDVPALSYLRDVRSSLLPGAEVRRCGRIAAETCVADRRFAGLRPGVRVRPERVVREHRAAQDVPRGAPAHAHGGALAQRHRGVRARARPRRRRSVTSLVPQHPDRVEGRQEPDGRAEEDQGQGQGCAGAPRPRVPSTLASPVPSLQAAPRAWCRRPPRPSSRSSTRRRSTSPRTWRTW